MKNKKASEKALEKSLRKAVTEMKGVALKFSSSYNTGWQDRFLLMPWGRLYLAEMKSEGKPLTRKQQIRVKRARKMMFTVFVIDDQETLDDAVLHLRMEMVNHLNVLGR